MDDLERDAYIEAHLFHTERWPGVANAFRAKSTQNNQPFRPCEPRRYSNDRDAVDAMEVEIEHQSLQWEYLSNLLLVLEYWDLKVAPELSENFNLDYTESKDLWKLLRSAPAQRANACYQMLKAKE